MISKKSATEYIAECDSLVTWNWDDRFQAVLSEFPADQEKEVMSMLEKHFDSCWDEETINCAPGKIRSVAKGLGKLRQGQRLFPSDQDQDALLLGAFWPLGEWRENIFKNPGGCSCNRHRN